MTQQFDAVVIGAGVALELARNGRLVAVVDRNSVAGAGSTSASSAIVRFNYSTYEGVAASWEAKSAGSTGRDTSGTSIPPEWSSTSRPEVSCLKPRDGLKLKHVLDLHEQVGILTEHLSAEELVVRC